MKSPDSDDRMEAELVARGRHLAKYLRIRGIVGIVLIVLGSLAAAVTLLIIAVAAGVFDIPFIGVWTHGYGAVAAPFMPGALAWLLIRTGVMWWRARHPEDPDTGCVAG